MCNTLFKSLVTEFLLYLFGILDVQYTGNFLSFRSTSVVTIPLYIGFVILIKSASSTKVPLISALYFFNGAQFLNATCVAAVSDCFTIF